MEFLVLGPLQVLDAGRPVTIGAPRQRALLAVLLANANRVVSTDRLLDLVWGEDPPEVGSLRYQVSKLRDTLEPDRGSGDGTVIVTESPGYVLRAGAGQLDALGFESLLSEAEIALSVDPTQALGMLDEALSLWRGDAYVDFAYEEFARPEIVRLEERRLEAIEARFDALLALGREREIVGELQALVAEHPHRERLTGALMLALYRSGRQADALAAYQTLRRELGDSLGIEPSKELVDLEERILLQDESLAVEAAPPAADYLRGYILRGRIGEGAHGVVWRAAQPGVGREVAIKAIHPDIANRPGFVRRFEMEAQLVASLEHPHIVSLFDFWRDPEGAYLVMPHLRGGNLAHLLQQGPLRPDTAFELIEAIGGALSYAHRRGVVHRDVTPHNVLLDDEGHPYLADFGVAALIGDTAGPSSSSPAYLAPEQHAGREAVPESDVFSLGVLAHSALTGEIPVADRPLHAPSRLNPDIPAAVDEVILRATADDVAERFIDPADFVVALAASLNGGSLTLGRAPEAVVRNPYKGLRAFAEADSPDFFGRDVAVSELVDAIARHRLVAVVGPSGCGKSSLVRAGLLADLRRGALPGSERWLITDMYPGTNPVDELAEALLRVAVERPHDLAERLTGDAVGDVPGELLPRDAELLLVVDQFEELFTLTTEETERRAFLDTLARLSADQRARTRVVVTLRADFFDRPLGYAGFGDLLRRGMVPITVPSLESLEQAVVGPAESVGLHVEPGLERVITKDVVDQPGGLPLLEFALTELFNERVGNELTAGGYQRTGGVLGALGRRAEDLFSGFDEAGRLAIEQVFLRLVTVEEGAEDTRRRIPLAELRQIGIEQGTLDRVLADYGSHRLLTFDRDPETRAPTVEVAHEALLTKWDRLRSWIDQRRDDLVLHRRLAAAVREWQDSERRSAYLFSGGRLEHYEHFAEETDLALTGPELGFLAAGRLAEDEMLARRRRRRLGVLAVLGSAAVIAAVLAVVAFLAQRRAEDASAEAQANEELAEQRAGALAEQTQVAEENAQLAQEQAAISRAAELASESRLAYDDDPELSILLALEAVAIDVEGGPLKEAVEALHEAVSASRIRFSTPGTIRAAMSGDGELVATRSPGGPVKVVRTTDGATVLELPLIGDPLLGELGELSMAVSPDGSKLATGRSDGTVAMWEIASGDEVFTTNDEQTISISTGPGLFALTFGGETTTPLPSTSDAAAIESILEDLAGVGDVAVVGSGTEEDPWIVDFLSVAASPIHRLGVGQDDATSLLGAESVTIQARGHVEPVAAVHSLEFAPDGRVVASGAWDGTIRLWDAVDWRQLAVLEAPVEPGNMRGMAFSPNGALLAAAGDDTVWVWEVETGTLVHSLETPGRTAIDVAFRGDGAAVYIARGVFGGALGIWDLTTGAEQSVSGAGDYKTSVAVNASGSLVAAGDDGGNVTILETIDYGLEPIQEVRAHRTRVWDLAFAAESDLLVSVGENFSRVQDLSESGSSEWMTLRGSPYGFPAVAYSPDGSMLARGPVDGNVVIVDAMSGEELQVLPAGVESVSELDFSPDGTRLAAAVTESGALVQVWDIAAGSLVAQPVTDEVFLGADWLDAYSVDFSPDGSYLAATIPPQVRVWDANTFEQVLALPAEESQDDFKELTFTPDGQQLAVRGTFDGLDTVRFYDLEGNLDRTCCEHFWFVWSASIEISPDGSRMVTGGLDQATGEGTVKVWDIASGDELATLEGHPAVVWDAVFSPDGLRIASGSGPDVRAWDAVTYDEIVELNHGDSAVFRVAFSPDGSRLVSTGDIEGLVRVWALDLDDLIQIAEDRLTRTLTAAECDIYDIEDCPSLE